MSKLNWMWKAIIIGVLILLIGSITVAVIQTIGKGRWIKNSNSWEHNYRALYDAPPKKVTTIDSFPVPYPVYIKVPTPVYHEPAKPKIPTGDSVSKACTSRYSIPVKFTEQGLTWRFLATYSIKDCFVEDMEISQAVLPKILVVETKSRDTCIENPDNKGATGHKSHWGVMGGIDINNFKRVPGIDMSLIYLYKDKWGVYGGLAYINPNLKMQEAINLAEDLDMWDNMYIRLGIILLFK